MRFTLLGAGILAALMISPAASAGELATSPSAMRAQSMLQRGSVPMLKRAAADRFVAQDVVVDRKGNEHVRFARTYRGLPVIGGGIVVHSRNGGLESVTQTMDELQRPGIVPSVDRRNDR